MYMTLTGAKHPITYLCFGNGHHQESVVGKAIWLKGEWRENTVPKDPGFSSG